MAPASSKTPDSFSRCKHLTYLRKETVNSPGTQNHLPCTLTNVSPDGVAHTQQPLDTDSEVRTISGSKDFSEWSVVSLGGEERRVGRCGRQEGGTRG